jgi:phosphoglycerate dehydrogenase-like enzyme
MPYAPSTAKGSDVVSQRSVDTPRRRDPFRLACTRNLFTDDDQPAFDFGLDLLEGRSDIQWSILPHEVKELSPADLEGYDGLFIEIPTRLTRASLQGVDRLRVVARFGVGYDNVDIDACTDNGVLVTITPDGVRRPMAVAAVTLLLALSQHLRHRELLTREERWNDRGRFLGVGLSGRTVGLVGFGNIGHETAKLLAPFDVRRLVSDPYATAEDAERNGCSLVDLETLLLESDFVVVLCALTDGTWHLIDANRLAMMKPSAFLVNVARGPIVDQAALIEALRANRIQGAGLDVFEEEPIPPGEPLLQLDNVIVTGHSLGWTDQCLRDCGLSALQSVIDVAEGRVPAYIVNRDALEHAQLADLVPSGGRA